MTEDEITKSLKFYKIYDCGLIRYVKYNKSETKLRVSLFDLVY